MLPAPREVKDNKRKESYLNLKRHETHYLSFIFILFRLVYKFDIPIKNIINTSGDKFEAIRDIIKNW